MKTLLHKITPHHACSRIVGLLARSQQPWLKNLLIKNFIRQYDVNMQLAEEPNYKAYGSFNDFFTRRLKNSIRPVAHGEWDIVSPVDGCVSEFGKIYKSRLFQAKGLDYSLQELLAGDQALTNEFLNGHFATYYLSPKDYHRVHMPFAGKLKSMRYVPGRLFSVNPSLTSCLPRLYARNERLICHFNTRLGSMLVIMVGATFVGSMSTVWAGTVTPNSEKNTFLKEYAEQGPHSLSLDKGKEMGHFNMGSTAIVLFPPVDIEWRENLSVDDAVNMGEKVARFLC